ncbi:MAG: hypothetical protein ACT4OM_06730 [Actinomycetota bacterium]
MAENVRPVSLAAEQTLPVLPAFKSILPEGLQRGQTLVVQSAAGAHSLALALIAGASKAGSWAAVAGTPHLGVAAAAEMGVAVERLLLVGPPARALWPTVAASLTDSFDLVVIEWPEASPSVARRLANRARERKAVLLAVGGDAWWEVADGRFTLIRSYWQGLERGHGRLSCRLANIEMSGRRAVRPRQLSLWLPGLSGAAEAAPEGVEDRPASVSRAV